MNMFFLVHTGQGKVREKNNFSRSGKSEGILNLVRDFEIFNIKSGILISIQICIQLMFATIF